MNDSTPLAKFTIHNFSGLLTTSNLMLEFMNKAARVAQTDASILLRGDSGTGKEMVARYIHQASARRDQTFNAVNCASLSRELVASELFGHKRGAFTGASTDRKGLFQLTDGGTLFLDEIAELPMDIQAGLLRVLQEQTFTPLGSSELLTTNIRLISATHTALRQLVADKAFREDLLYRVRVVPLYLPPLVERDDDIAMLSWYFIEQFNEKYPRTIKQIEQAAFDRILTYSYPGNVRELKNVIEYAHAIGDGENLIEADLPPDLLGLAPSDERPHSQHQQESARIEQLLQQYHGHKQQVADALGISRATLWRKMKALGIG